MVGIDRIELSFSAYETVVFPLYDTPKSQSSGETNDYSQAIQFFPFSVRYLRQDLIKMAYHVMSS